MALAEEGLAVLAAVLLAGVGHQGDGKVTNHFLLSINFTSDDAMLNYRDHCG